MAPSLQVEHALLESRCERLACVDEVGRGALADPFTLAVFGVSLWLLIRRRINSAWLVLAGALAGWGITLAGP